MTETILVLLILFVATLTRSTFGFGEALIAMPLLSFVLDDVKVAAAVVALVALANSGAILSTDWRNIEWKGAWRLTTSAFVGVPFGVYALTRVPASAVKLGEPVLLMLLQRLISEPGELAVNAWIGAGWVGLLVTSLNLFPVGQLDGVGGGSPGACGAFVGSHVIPPSVLIADFPPAPVTRRAPSSRRRRMGAVSPTMTSRRSTRMRRKRRISSSA